MDKKQVLDLYDKNYAAAYDQKFLLADVTKTDTETELKILSELIRPGMRWLDLACGTGYFLSKFPHLERAGLDLSPAMLEHAKACNPGVSFFNQSYLEPMPDWEGKWDFISCMWYAYGLIGSMNDIRQLVENMADWTSPTGQCFLPLADPCLVAQVNIPYEVVGPWPGRVFITGIMWSYVEEGEGKSHAHQVAPQIPLMREFFGRRFAKVEILKYPPAMPGWEGVRCALVASEKRPEPLSSVH